MDEIFGRRDLIAPGRLKELSVKSNLLGAIRVGGHLGALAVSGAALLLSWGTLWAVPAFVVHGTLINFLYAGQHEASATGRCSVPRSWLKPSSSVACSGSSCSIRAISIRFSTSLIIALRRIGSVDGELARGVATASLPTYWLWMSGLSYWYTRVRRIVRFSLGHRDRALYPQERKGGSGSGGGRRVGTGRLWARSPDCRSLFASPRAHVVVAAHAGGRSPSTSCRTPSSISACRTSTRSP